MLYDGTDITTLSDKELTLFRKENVGFIFQQYYLLPNMSVDKNVKMGADLGRNKAYRNIIEEQTGRQVLDYICKLQKKYGFTIVMVTHNLNIAEMATTVIKMNSGKVTEIYTNKIQKTAYEIGW